MIPRPPTSTLFPYTTLFRSFSATDRSQACSFDPSEPDYPDTAHIVMSIRGGKLANAAAFVWDKDRKDFVERSEEHTSELQSQFHLVCRLLLEKKNKQL